MSSHNVLNVKYKTHQVFEFDLHNDTLVNNQNSMQLRYRDVEKLSLFARSSYEVVMLNERHEEMNERVERNEKRLRKEL